jgi:hypothetical protein
MRTLLIDCPFSLESADVYDFWSGVSIFDYDRVIWDPLNTAEKLSDHTVSNRFRGQPSLSEAQTVKFLEAINRRRSEFEEFIELGRVLILIATPPQIFWVSTGEKRYSGTGKNRAVTNILKDIDLTSAMPYRYKSRLAEGAEITPVGEVAMKLWRETRGDWIYRCVLEEFAGEELMKVSGTNKVVGSLLTTESGGVLAVLPEPWRHYGYGAPPEDALDRDDESGSDGEESIPGEDVIAESIPMVVQWAEGLQNSGNEPLPEWATNLRFQSEVSRSEELVKIEQEIAILSSRSETLKIEQAQEEQWKRLFTAQGTSLEFQVKLAFEYLGFECLEVRKGRSDLRLKYGDELIVVEIKGLGKSAGEKNSAQLEKWVAEEASMDCRSKGILVINGWRNAHPKDREEVFPHQMLAYATSRGHCLVTGIQVLLIKRSVEAGTVSKETAARLLLDSVGRLPGFDEVSDYFIATIEDEAELYRKCHSRIKCEMGPLG